MLPELLLTCFTSISGGVPSKASDADNISQETSTQLLSESDIQGFSLISDPEPFKAIESSDGYLYLDVSLYKSPYTEKSNLYILNTEATFTPGVVALANGSKQSNGESFVQAYLSSGFLHVEIKQAYNEGWRKSGAIAIKECWPQSSNVSTTISSSFGSTLSEEFSIDGGVEIGNGGFVGKGGVGYSTSLSFSFQKNLSSLTSDPVLSHQRDPQNANNLQWSYRVLKNAVAGSISYVIDSYVIFEMDTSASSCHPDSCIAYFDTMYTNVDSEGDNFKTQANYVNSVGFFLS